MFHKTSLKLTAVYLLIIMLISLFFSITLYSLSAHEFDRGFRSQDVLFDDEQLSRPISNGFQKRFIESRDEASREAKVRVLAGLAIINIVILFVGGGLSYVLARRSLEPIEEAHRVLERFTADASHELRTPIAAMKTEIEVALMQPNLSIKDAKSLLRSNLEEIDSLTELTSGLLSLARQEEGLLDLQTCQVKSIVMDAVDKIQPIAELKSIKFNKSFDANSPGILADKEAAVQALVIILDNAIKYSPRKSLVTISEQQDGGLTNIIISDHGSGIEPNDLPHIFERFYRSDVSRTKLRTKGFGLGLAIAKQLIESQSGTIDAKSEPGKYTTITVSLPSSN